MSLTTESTWANAGGTLSVHTHASDAVGGNMQFGVFTPPQAKQGPVPVLWYLSGLTCNWSNVMDKSGIQHAAAKHGLMIVAPDTSPRGDTIANDEAYDLGQGAGFYLTATQSPWAPHFAMDTYIRDELPEIIGANFPADLNRQGITGHSMGGHGALTLHLKNPQQYQSASAFSPIACPSQVPWGRKAFNAYLGSDEKTWANYDASKLVAANPSSATLLIDTGDADQFLDEQLTPNAFIDACKTAGQKLNYRLQPGYDHSYYFVSSFIEEHVAHHAAILNKG